MLQLKVMHDEVSETENIRKNLAIERMIIEGCDILLDTSQVFVRQGRIASALESSQQNLCVFFRSETLLMGLFCYQVLLFWILKKIHSSLLLLGHSFICGIQC